MTLPSYEDAFEYIAKKAGDTKLIVVIDEFPYLAKAYPAVMSILQNAIDSKLEKSNIFLIISGSSISFMENEVLSDKSPLYGRRTGQMKLNPFTYEDTALFVPDYGPTEKAITYGVTVGITKYLSLRATEFHQILGGYSSHP